jgi:hypothetical protein
MENIVGTKTLLKSVHGLQQLLETHRIDFTTWGVAASTRTIDELWREIASHESTLYLGQDGKLWRVSSGVKIRVFYTPLDGKPRLLLQEARQVYKDGRLRNRVEDGLDMSIGEKRKAYEPAVVAVRRAFEEELGIDGSLIADYIVYDGPETKDSPSKAFPGLYTRYESERFQVELPDQVFRPEGYIERQPDKTNYFEWVPAPTDPQGSQS